MVNQRSILLCVEREACPEEDVMTRLMAHIIQQSGASPTLRYPLDPEGRTAGGLAWSFDDFNTPKQRRSRVAAAGDLEEATAVVIDGRSPQARVESLARGAYDLGKPAILIVPDVSQMDAARQQYGACEDLRFTTFHNLGAMVCTLLERSSQ